MSAWRHPKETFAPSAPQCYGSMTKLGQFIVEVF